MIIPLAKSAFVFENGNFNHGSDFAAYFAKATKAKKASSFATSFAEASSYAKASADQTAVKKATNGREVAKERRALHVGR